MAKATYWTVNDTEARKRGEQTGLDMLYMPNSDKYTMEYIGGNRATVSFLEYQIVYIH